MFEEDTDSESERAVSPVIGVILMVAITVILAAVIAAFVLDLGQGQSANPQAGITTDTNGDNVTFTVNSVSRADSLYISGNGDCAWLYDDGGTPGSPAEEKSLSASAGASKTIHFGTETDVEGATLLCDSSDGTYGGGGSTASSGNIQIIGEFDGQRSVIATYELG